MKPNNSVQRIQLTTASSCRRFAPQLKRRPLCGFVEEWGNDMDYDPVKVDELVLALLHLTSFQDHGVTRAWKGHDWDALNRLHETGLISDPKSKAKSVVLTEDGIRLSEQLFEKYCRASK